MRFRALLCALPLLLGMVSSAQAADNLIVNGSFETPDLGTGWSLYDSIDGWTKVGTPKIEIGHFGNYGDISGYDGDQICELDSTGNARIKQTVAVEVGKRYKLQFLTVRRGGTSNASNQVTVYYNNGESATINPTSTTMQEHTYTFIAASNSMDLEFQGGGTSDSLGSIIDHVRLYYDNQPPVAVADAYTVAQAMTLTKPAAEGVLENDQDADYDPLTAELLTGPANGTLVFNADGSFTYTPFVYFTGTDTLTYRALDGFDVSAPATVTIEVTAPNAFGFITGGGRLDGVKRTFGLVAKIVGNGEVKGNLEYIDHEVGNKVKSNSVDWVYVVSPNLGYFSGTCSVNGVDGFTFFVEVQDGDHDFLKIWVFDSMNNVVYQSEGVLFGGNIKIH